MMPVLASVRAAQRVWSRPRRIFSTTARRSLLAQVFHAAIVSFSLNVGLPLAAFARCPRAFLPM
jgi:hypothetical protein